MSTQLNPRAQQYAEQATALGLASAIEPALEKKYGGHAGQRFEVYHASSDKRPLPVVIFVHGGAWMNGGLEWLRFMAPNVVALPAVFVAVTHRQAPEHRWPAQYEDIRDAVNVIVSECADWGGDPARVVLAGHSSGGHLAAMVTLLRETPPVAGCMTISSALDLRFGDVAEDSPEARVYKYLLNRRDEDADASPVCFVEGNQVPFHLTWGEQDYARIFFGAMPMVAALKSAGSPVDYSVISDADHFDTHLALADAGCDWYRQLRKLISA